MNHLCDLGNQSCFTIEHNSLYQFLSEISNEKDQLNEACKKGLLNPPCIFSVKMEGPINEEKLACHLDDVVYTIGPKSFT